MTVHDDTSARAPGDLAGEAPGPAGADPGAGPSHDPRPRADETHEQARARRRAEVPAPGSVEQEAALLVDLLSERGWGPRAGMPSGAPSQPGADERPRGATGPTTTEGQHPASAGHRHEPQTGGGPSADSDPHADGPRDDGAGSRRECTCGGRTPAACTVCPVCQLIAFVRKVEPDAIDRLADVVDLAATALRDLATSQRARREESSDESSPGSASGSPSAQGREPRSRARTEEGEA